MLKESLSWLVQEISMGENAIDLCIKKLKH